MLRGRGPLMVMLVAVGLALGYPVTGQSAPAPTRADLLAIARDVVASVPIPVLATADDEGWPAVRPMDAHPPDEDWVVWMATNPNSRKVGHVRARARVALHYLDATTPAYVTLVGTARLVDDPATKARHWKESWTPFYPNRERDALLIEVTPVRLEVVSEAAGVPGDPTTWRAHVVEFRPPADGGNGLRGGRRPR